MENTITAKQDLLNHEESILIQGSKNIIPKLSVQSDEIDIGLNAFPNIKIDLAKVCFIHNQHEFNFADLSSGRVMPDGELLQQMAIYNHQLEKLDSIYSHFESIVTQYFHINDRYLESDFTAYAPLLRGLQLDGWQVEIDDSYRLNQVKAKNWYAEIKKNDKDESHWFDLELGVKIEGQTVNILPYLVKSIQSGQLDSNSLSKDFSITLENGKSVGIDHKSIQQILSTLTELYDSKSLNKKDNLTLSKTQLIRIQQLQEAINDSIKDENNDSDTKQDSTNETPVLRWHGDLSLKQKAEQIAQNIYIQQTQAPNNLNAELREYQLKGLSWLQFLTQNHLGGILADDMGLGKTLQTLSHILTEKNQGRLNHPCLIVVPTSLLSNWESEIEKFTPSLSCLLLLGPNRSKLYKKLQQYDIVICSYGIMMRDVKYLSQQQFYLMILDEAQAIKNSKTRNAKVACQIPSLYRLCLSGTPIENHLGELWSLFNFLMPGFLSTEKQFNEIYQTPIEKLKNEDRQTSLSKRLAPFMLRRTKKEVAQELPDKTEIIQLIELNESQSNLYETIRLTMTAEIKEALEKSNNQFVIGNALLRLRQVCCHPALLKLESLKNEELESAKLDWLSTVLPNMVEEGNRILLFSSFTSMLDIIAEQLKQLGIDYLSLTGKTPANKRGQLVEEFQSGNIPVFLISLKAGGSGLNLTAADTVIHFDPWWNPASEQQASDRAHRIGQDKNVFVYKLISKGTVEQRIQKMQQQKQALADGIFDKQDSSSHLSDAQQWQELLKPISSN
jgi:non-specific serine/threonine protein kinase